MREFPGFGRFGSVVRADVVLLKGHDAPSAAAPEASARFFTNSRRFIFTRCSERNRRRAYCCSAIAAEGGIWSFIIADKIARVYEFQVKNRPTKTESNADIR